jgi:NADP-dependent 3-hydroxy acid dehydrogenase YdfG
MNNMTNYINWENPRLAIITGASSGIGEEFAKQLAKQGQYNRFLISIMKIIPRSSQAKIIINRLKKMSNKKEYNSS